jgi:hypothetical protein
MRKEIPDEVINEIAKLAKIKDPTRIARLGSALRNLLKEVSEQNSRFRRTASGRIARNKRDIKDADQIRKLSKALSGALKKISPSLRSEFAGLQIFLPVTDDEIPLPLEDLSPLVKLQKPQPLEELQEAVAILNTYSKRVHDIILSSSGKGQKRLRDLFLTNVYLYIKQLGGHVAAYSGTRSGDMSNVVDLLRNYLPKEIGDMDGRTIYRAIQPVTKMFKTPIN